MSDDSQKDDSASNGGVSESLTRETIAFHEAGHAVMSVIEKRGFGKTVIHEEGGAMHVQRTRAWRQAYVKKGKVCVANLGFSRRNLRRDLLITVAGPVAQAKYEGAERVFVDYRTPDGQQAMEFAGKLARGSEDPDDIIGDAIADAILVFYRSPPRWKAVEAVAAHLIEHGEASSRKVRDIVRQVEDSTPGLD